MAVRPVSSSGLHIKASPVLHREVHQLLSDGKSVSFLEYARLVGISPYEAMTIMMRCERYYGNVVIFYNEDTKLVSFKMTG